MTTILNFSPSKLLNPATDELKLISLSQQGDAEAFARLYACYVERITRYVYLRVTDHELAEDITSRIFLKVLEKLDTYQVGQLPIGAWLYRMDHNAISDYYRTKKTFISLEDVHPAEVKQVSRRTTARSWPPSSAYLRHSWRVHRQKARKHRSILHLHPA